MNREIIARADAKAQGLKFYFTGNPCVRGGISERRVSNGDCLCEACRACVNEKNRILDKRFREKNKQATAARKRRWAEKNKKLTNDRARRYRLRNKAVVADTKRRYYNQNREKYASYRDKRRAAELQSIPSWFGEFDELVVMEAHELAVWRLHETGIEWHVDHMVPLIAKKCCGLHCAENIQVIPALMNLQKNNRMELTRPLEWLYK